MKSPKVKRTLIIAVLTLFIILNTFIFVFNANVDKAQAQVDTGLSGIIRNVGAALAIIKEKVFDLVKTGALNSAVQTMSRRFAASLATKIAAGNKGGSPSFWQDTFKDSFNDAAGAAAGDFIGTLSETTYDQLGLDLCDPDINLKFKIEGALLSTEEPPPPKCEWKDIEKNWREFSAKINDEDEWLNQITFSLTPGRNDFSTTLAVMSETENKKNEAEEEVKNQRLSSEYKSLQTLISNQIKTPSKFIEKQTEELIPKAPDSSNAMTIGAYLSKNIFAPFVNQFVSSFTATLMNKWLTQGLAQVNCTLQNNCPGSKQGGSGNSGLSSNVYYSGGYSQADVAASFNDILTPTFGQIDKYQQLDDFVICNTSEPMLSNKLNNCVMTQNFYSAVTQDPPISIRQAIDLNYISGDLLFISPNDNRNQDVVFCWQSALCYGNIQKMVEARILPLGWLVAAAKVGQGGIAADVTLKEIMDNFNTPDDPPGSNPYYHLIDPNWILKAPGNRCAANVYSGVLENPGGESRSQSCADLTSCVKEDEQGNCLEGAYGYCTKDKNIWRLGGDQCEEYYNTCDNLRKTSDNSLTTLVKTSLESCNPDGAGCQWYATSSAKNLVTNQWVWQPNKRIYFNNNTSGCDSQDAGCSQFIRTLPGSNLLYNGDFEIASSTNPLIPDGWTNLVTSGTYAYQGVTAYNNFGLNNSRGAANSPGASGFNYQLTQSLLPLNHIKLFPYEYYTLSVWAKPTTTYAPVLRVANSVSTTPLGSVISYSGGAMVIGGTDSSFSVVADTTLPNQDGWYFLSLTFLTSPNLATPFSVTVTLYSQGPTTPTAITALFDNVQLEKAQVPSQYYDYGTVNMTYLKKAPDYYQCYGYTKKLYGPDYDTEADCESSGYFWRTDISTCVENGNSECSNYALYCQNTEIGCQLYTPLNGDPALPGVAKPSDYCLSECDGYQSYIEDVNYFDTIELTNPLPTSKNLIASTATTCTASELDCEEFTNLDEVAEGGEGKEYYSYIRQCVLPANTGVKTFYTWEGSDTSGYQLKIWELLESIVSGFNGINGPETGKGPCTNVPVSLTSTALTLVCVDTTLNIEDCDPSLNDPDCRQFFDEQGNSHYRLQQRTITASTDCQPFRRTASGMLYNAIPSEGTTCPASANGCRSYRGNTASNIRIAFTDDFEDGDSVGWQNGTMSNNSVNTYGHSYKAITGYAIQTATYPSVIYTAENDLTIGKKYQLVLVAKKTTPGGSVTITPKLSNGTAAQDVSFGSINVTDDWQQLTLGPVELPATHNLTNFNSERLVIGNNIYLDSIILKELNENLYLIKDTWETPISCDNPFNNPTGLVNNIPGNRTSIGAMLNCQSYQDSSNNTLYLHSLTNLCSEEAVGCEAMIDTYNSSVPYLQNFNLENNNATATSTMDDLKVLADNYIYLVNSESKQCLSAYKGCTQLGLPVFDTAPTTTPIQIGNIYDYNVTGYNDVYKINDPDQYNSTLCSQDLLFCTEYRNDNSSLFYFFDPKNRLCEYKENIMIGTTPETGWFRVGTLTPCYATSTDPYVLEPAYIGPAANNNFEGWAGVCPSDQSGCTEFVDPYASMSENLIANPGFEADYDDNDIPDYYTVEGAGMPEYSLNQGVGDSKAVKAVLYGINPIYDNIHQNINFHAGKKYYLSVKSKTTTTGSVVEDTINLYINVCTAIGTTYPTYPTFSSPDNSFDMYNNGSAQVAAVAQFTTTGDYREYGGQLIANQDTICGFYFGSALGQGMYFDDLTFKELAPYYYINDDKLDKQSCNGQVSAKEGCVLFQDTSSPTLSFASGASYKLSSDQSEGMVSPIVCQTGDTGCDSNTILRVIRDRACAEWYGCTSMVTNYNANTGSYEQQCTQLGLCDKYSGASTTGYCANWINNENPVLLTEDLYKARDTTFSGRDYTGYSLFNKYPLNTIEVADVFDVPGIDDDVFRLVKDVGEGTTPSACEDLGVTLGLYPAVNPSNTSLIPVNSYGSCYLGIDNIGLHCTVASGVCDPSSHYHGTEQDWDMVGESCGSGGTCELGVEVTTRGFAVDSSPFPSQVNDNQSFAQANLCIESQGSFDEIYNPSFDPGQLPGIANPQVADLSEDVNPSAGGTGKCDITYTKAEYGNGIKTLYFGQGITPPYEYIDCGNAACNDNNQVHQLTKKTTIVNWGGYCVDADTSRTLNNDPNDHACTTWLPLNQTTGIMSTANQFVKAGYVPASNNEYYCEQAKGNSQSYSISSNIVKQCNTPTACDIDYPINNNPIYNIDNNGWIINDSVNYRTYAKVDNHSVLYTPWGGYNNYEPNCANTDATFHCTLDVAIDNNFYVPGLYGGCSGATGSGMEWALNETNNTNIDTSIKKYELEKIEAVVVARQDNDWPAVGTRCVLDRTNNFDKTGTGNKCWEDSSNHWEIKINFSGPANCEDCNISSFNAHIKDDSAVAGGIFYKLIYYLREPCNILIKVVDPTQGNKAWTNRTWSGSGYSDTDLSSQPCTGESYCNQYPNYLGPSNNNQYLSYRFNTRNSPGGMGYFGLNAIGPTATFPWFVGDWYLGNYNAGGPYSCEGNCGGASCVASLGKDGQPCIASQLSCANPSDPACHNNLKDCVWYDSATIQTYNGLCVGQGKVCNGGTNYGNPCNADADCIGGSCSWGGYAATNQTTTFAKQHLSQLFAKSYGAYRWDDAASQYEEINPSHLEYWTYNWDITGETNLNGLGSASNYYHDGVFLFAVSPTNQARMVSPNKLNIITINGVATSTLNVIGNSTLMTNIQFYFQSDNDSLPLRRLKINWGDGSSLFDEQGYFQNHLAVNECCDNLAGCTDFGKTPNACIESYYQASHLYSYALAPETGYDCDDVCPDGNTGDDCNEPNILLSDGRRAKCFKPGVQITDNWGWCNGGWDYNGVYQGGVYGEAACADTEIRSAKSEPWVVIYP